MSGRPLVRRVAADSLRLLAVLIVTWLLFMVIPVMHRLFGINLDPRDSGRQLRVMAEIYKPPPPPEKKREQRMRRMSGGGEKTGQSGSRAAGFKFTPDLGVAGSGAILMQDERLEAVTFEEGEVDEAVVPVSLPAVPFPDKARELGVEGILEALLVVNESGQVSSVEIVTSPHPSISDQARQVMQRWKFKPARKAGMPVRMRVKQVIEFTLE
jgi:TonB family protein